MRQKGTIGLSGVAVALMFFSHAWPRDACAQFEAKIRQFSSFVQTRRQEILNILRPGNGRADPRLFLLRSEDRKKRIPDLAAVYDSSEDEMVRSVQSWLHGRSWRGGTVRVVERDCVYFWFERDRFGQERNRGGEPGYGYSLEISRELPRVPHFPAIPQARTQECGGVFIRQYFREDGSETGITIAIPLTDSQGVQLGEVHLDFGASDLP